MPHRYTFVLNTGKDATTDLDSYTYSTKGTAKSIAFTNCSVNPIIKSTGVVSATSTDDNTVGGEVNAAQDDSIEKLSANFFEIRNGPYDGEISNVSYSAIVNRVFPSGSPTVITNYGINQQKTKSFKIRTYRKTEAVQGQKMVGSGGLGIDLDTYDYFVLINPEVTGDDGTVSIRPHFAKIKQIISFDEYGDGFDFEPKYGGPVPKGANIEIYKGPHKINDTDVVAVSYGLRGNTNATSGLSDKYDTSNTVSRPTWYFYNDRLSNENQLNYNTKYTLTTCRWFSPFYTITGALTTTSNTYQSSSNSTVTYAGSDPVLIPGQTLYAYNSSSGVRKILGNIVDNASETNLMQLDTMRNSLPTYQVGENTISPVGQLGSTVHQTVFLTEQEHGNIISDLGRYNQDAILVDNIHDLSDTNTDYDMGADLTNSLGVDAKFDPSVWKDAIRNYSRNNAGGGLTGDFNSSHSSYAPTGSNRLLFANLDGAKRHIYYKSAKLKNNIVSTVLDARVNLPRNKISQIAKVKSLDHAGLQHLKLKEDDSLVVRTSIYSGTLGEHKLPYSATSETIGGIYQIYLNQIGENFDYKNDSFIKVNDIIRVGVWFYRVSATADPAGNKQIIKVNKKKHVNGTSFATITTLESFTNAEIFVRSWNGGLAGSIPIDTEVVYDSNAFKRLTIEGNTVSKKETNLYNNNLVLLEPQFFGHNIPIDYGDSVHKHIKLQDPLKQLYQLNPVSFLYYVSGKFSIDEEVFSGTIEDIESKNEKGFISYTISGRDSLSKLLSNTVSKNLNHSDDIVYSSLSPVNEATRYSVTGSTTNTITISSTNDVDVYDIVLDNTGLLIGEVLSESNGVITLKDNVINTVTAAVDIIELGKVNYLAATKALGANKNHSKYPTDFSAAGEKGIIFNDGLILNRGETETELVYTSATTGGSYQEDKSLGYDMTDVRGIITNKDSDFATKLALEDELTITYKTIHTPCSPNYYEVIDINVKEGGLTTTLKLAPTFPVVLGSIETNTSDDNYGEASQPYIYMVNKNIPSGGFIHTLTSTHGNYYTPDQTFRYMNLQENEEGAIYETHTSIYNSNLKPQKIMASTPAYKINLLGVKQNLVDANKTKAITPINGSNMLDTQLGSIIPIQHHTGSAVETAKWSQLINPDYRTKNYELMAIGDIYPESKLRQNHIGFSEQDLGNYGMLLESDGSGGESLTHQNYTGTSNETLRSDANYERIEIDSATIKSNAIKRFGIVRLVEATFDWHFNPLDYESTPPTKDIPKLEHTNYSRFNLITNGVNSIPSGGTNRLLTTNITPTDGDLVYKSDGTIYARLTSGNTGTSSTNVIHANDIIGSADYSGAVVIVTPKHFQMVADPDYGIDTLGENGIKMQNVYLALPNIERTYFKFGLLWGYDIGNQKDFDAHNVFIPLISKTNEDDDLQTVYSAFHEANDWGAGTSATYYHPSKVLNAICTKTYDGSPDDSGGWTLEDTDAQYNVHPDAHLYDNCLVLFKDMKKGTGQDGQNKRFSNPTSAYLMLDTDDRYEDYLDVADDALVEDGQHIDQISKNLMVSVKNSVVIHPAHAHQNIALTGTKTKRHIWSAPDGDSRSWGGRDQTHSEAETGITTRDGDLFQAQMFVKPFFDLTGLSGTTFSLTLNSSTKHKWLNFLPNLTGYYLVSEKLVSGDYLPNQNTSVNHVADGEPKFIAKITGHTVDLDSGYSRHNFTVDTAINVSTNGVTYRLMRISETTFEDTPDYFDINKMFDTGLKNNVEMQNFITGQVESGSGNTNVTDNELVYQQGLYSMYLLLDIDKQNTYLERRTLTSAKTTFNNITTLECYVTDGKTSIISRNSKLKSINVTTNDNLLRLSYNGTLTGNGVVSFGQTFTVESSSDPKLSNPKRAYIGTTISVGTDTEKAIEEILEENNIDVDTTERNIVYTNNIVASTTTTTITCLENISGIEENDIIYNQDGKLIGKVASKLNKVITLTDVDGDSTVDIYHSPSENDEITKYTRKPLITNVNFNENDVFNSINFLASKRGLDYTFVSNKIKIQELDSYNNRRRFSLRYKDGKNLLSVDSNKSMFDRANKVIVIGDNTKAISHDFTKKQTRTIKHIDSNIKNKREAEMKALELLEFHSRPYRKITLTLQKEGLELMKPGDLITLNFPNHDIPPDDYIVFEIENVMAEMAKITVGTFNKTVAERLAEINLAQDKSLTNLFTKTLSQTITSKAAFQATKVSESSLKYTTTGTSGAIIGF